MTLYIIISLIVAIAIGISIYDVEGPVIATIAGFMVGFFLGAIIWGLTSIVWPFHKDVVLSEVYALIPITSPTSGQSFEYAGLKDNRLVVQQVDDEEQPQLLKISMSDVEITMESEGSRIEYYRNEITERNWIERQLGALDGEIVNIKVFVPQKELKFIDFNF